MADDTKRGTHNTQELPELGTVIAKPVRGIRHRPRRAHALEITGGPAARNTFPLDRDSIAMGRSSQADVQLDSDEVSRMHCRLLRIDDEYVIEDQGSRNGIYVNGLKVHSAVLRDGDELQLGDVLMQYREGN
jgi:pSer/pThr/pTyr-binding forkhead associated (FHA) protein